jgi:hypothetical protein
MCITKVAFAMLSRDVRDHRSLLIKRERGRELTAEDRSFETLLSNPFRKQVA